MVELVIMQETAQAHVKGALRQDTMPMAESVQAVIHARIPDRYPTAEFNRITKGRLSVQGVRLMPVLDQTCAQALAVQTHKALQE